MLLFAVLRVISWAAGFCLEEGWTFWHGLLRSVSSSSCRRARRWYSVFGCLSLPSCSTRRACWVRPWLPCGWCLSCIFLSIPPDTGLVSRNCWTAWFVCWAFRSTCYNSGTNPLQKRRTKELGNSLKVSHATESGFWLTWLLGLFMDLSLNLTISHSSWERLSSLESSSICKCLSLWNERRSMSRWPATLEILLSLATHQELLLIPSAIWFLRSKSFSSLSWSSFSWALLSSLISSSCLSWEYGEIFQNAAGHCQ